MKHSYCSISSSTELSDDRSWDVRMFQVVVAVAFAVVLNCLVSLSFRKALSAPLSRRCRSAGHCRYLNYLRLTHRCQRAMVVMNLKVNKMKKKSLESTREKQLTNSQNILVGFFDFEFEWRVLERDFVSMVVETDFVYSIFHGIGVEVEEMHLFQSKEKQTQTRTRKGFVLYLTLAQ